jgi:hypothetical protein
MLRLQALDSYHFEGHDRQSRALLQTFRFSKLLQGEPAQSIGSAADKLM